VQYIFIQLYKRSSAIEQELQYNIWSEIVYLYFSTPSLGTYHCIRFALISRRYILSAVVVGLRSGLHGCGIHHMLNSDPKEK